MKRSHVLTADDLEPHGLRCPYCDRDPFEPGDEVVEYLEGMIEDTPLVLSGVCPECAEKIEVWNLVKCPDCDGCGEQGHGYGVEPSQCRRCRGVGEIIGFPKTPDQQVEDAS